MKRKKREKFIRNVLLKIMKKIFNKKYIKKILLLNHYNAFKKKTTKNSFGVYLAGCGWSF
jgi:hypothetical protein